MVAKPFRLQSKSFSKLFTGYTINVGMAVSDKVKRNFSLTFTFYRTKGINFDGLKLTFVYKISFLSPIKGTGSSMNILINGGYTPILLIMYDINTMTMFTAGTKMIGRNNETCSVFFFFHLCHSGFVVISSKLLQH